MLRLEMRRVAVFEAGADLSGLSLDAWRIGCVMNWLVVG